jgi:hypothetical protein
MTVSPLIFSEEKSMNDVPAGRITGGSDLSAGSGDRGQQCRRLLSAGGVETLGFRFERLTLLVPDGPEIKVFATT